MDPATLATTVLAVLTPYLVKTGDRGIIVKVGGKVQKNIVIGNDNSINAAKHYPDESASHRPEKRKPL